MTTNEICNLLIQNGDLTMGGFAPLASPTGLPAWGWLTWGLAAFLAAGWWLRRRDSSRVPYQRIPPPPVESDWNPDSRELTARFSRAIPEIRCPAGNRG